MRIASILAAAAIAACEAAPVRHLLMLVIDDLRPELSVYGHDYMHTPNFERLAARGLTLDRAFCQQAVCAPSRNSFMTGRNPDKTHAFNFIQHFRDAGIGQAWTTFPGLFKRNGYLSFGAGKLFHPGLPPNFDGTNSWSNVTLNGTANLPFLDPGMPPCPKSKGLKKCVVDDDSYFADNDSVDAWRSMLSGALRDHSGTPTASWVGLHKPHLPFRRPASFDKQYPPWNETDLAEHRTIAPGAPLISWHDTHDNPNPWTPHPDDDERMTRHAYRATVSFCDSMVGRVLDTLEELGITNDTAILSWADHGWRLSEHGQWRKMAIDELATHVPAFMAVPWMPQSHGKRSRSLVDLVDMMPTAAELMGVPLMQNETIDGVSQVTLLQDPQATGPRNASFSQYPRCPKNASIPWKDNACLQVNETDLYAMGYSVRQDAWRYNEWVRWDGSNSIPVWDEVLGVELYPYNSSIENDFNAVDNLNLANRSEYHDIQADLQALLHSHFKHDGCVPFKTC